VSGSEAPIRPSRVLEKRAALVSSSPSAASREFERVYERFFAPVRAKCLRVLSSPQAADDVAQEVFLRLWQWPSRPALDAPDAIRTLLAWLYVTSTRLSIDVLRARGAREPSTESPLPCAVRVDEALGARRTIEQLRRAVPDDELEAAILCRVDGLSQPEAALVLGASERTVRRLLSRFDERTRSVRKELVP
jgi:RNA polymerase sigma-70 factor (ECF subfamily)